PLADERNETRLPVNHRPPSFLRHDRLGARASDPTLHGAVLQNEGLGPRLGRGRTLAPHDSRQGERLASVRQLDGKCPGGRAHLLLIISLTQSLLRTDTG